MALADSRTWKPDGSGKDGAGSGKAKIGQDLQPLLEKWVSHGGRTLWRWQHLSQNIGGWGCAQTWFK